MTTSPSLKAIQACMAEGVPPSGSDDASARRLWWAALDTLQEQLQEQNLTTGGLWLAAPLPALYDPTLLKAMRGWVWSPNPQGLPQLGPAGPTAAPGDPYKQLPLHPDDGHDPLLVVIQPTLQVALALQGPPDQRQLLMRSDPKTLGAILSLLEQRLRADAPDQADALHDAIRALGSLQSSSAYGEQFWPVVAERLARMAPSLTLQTLRDEPGRGDSNEPIEGDQYEGGAEAELSLLEAITHEVRTPLATIRTLIRSLLRRRDLAPVVMERLQQIDSECTEQIDRFGLIFHAAELQRQSTEPAELAQTDLGAVLQHLAPGWQMLLERRGVALQIEISPNLPAVLSDPSRLEPMLGGLIDRSSRGLQQGGQLVLQLRPAGARLKLQIRGYNPSEQGRGLGTAEPTAELGPVLSWNPGTGSLQLSQAATRRLLASLGGRLAQQRDRGLTVFFPVAGRSQC